MAATIDDLSYLNAALHPRARAYKIREAVRCLKRYRADWDGIVCTGTSGLLMGPTLADKLGIPCAVVRRQGVYSHSNHTVEGLTPERLLFVDDFVERGDTVKRVTEAVSPLGCRVVATYTYGKFDQRAVYVNDSAFFLKPSYTMRLSDDAAWRGKALRRENVS